MFKFPFQYRSVERRKNGQVEFLEKIRHKPDFAK